MSLHFERLARFVNNSLPDSDEGEEIPVDIKGGEYNLSCMSRKNMIFDFSNNNLIGHIPTSIGNLSSLQFAKFI